MKRETAPEPRLIENPRAFEALVVGLAVPLFGWGLVTGSAHAFGASDLARGARVEIECIAAFPERG